MKPNSITTKKTVRATATTRKKSILKEELNDDDNDDACHTLPLSFYFASFSLYLLIYIYIYIFVLLLFPHPQRNPYFQTHRIPPCTTRHSMPSFSKDVTMLLFLVMTSSILTFTTTVIVAASSAATVGGTNDLRPLVRKIKNSKKQGNKNTNDDDTCTMEPFLGTSQYTNCEGDEMEVKIACANTDDTATATNTTPTTRLCSYLEHPLQDDDAAAGATAAGCGDQGSFDPRTHLTRDHTTGVCRLKFFRLTSTCIGVPAKSGFGVMVEVASRTDTGSDNHHGQIEDKNHKDNSGMLLHFSRTGGADYYNEDDQRETVPLHGIIPAERKLNNFATCVTPKDKFNGWSCDNVHYYFGDDSKVCVNKFGGIKPQGEDEAFETCSKQMKNEMCVNNIAGFKPKDEDEAFKTCFALGGPKTGILCWSNSRYSCEWTGWYPCVPSNLSVHDKPPVPWYVAQPRDDGSCGAPCGKYGFNQEIKYPPHNNRCRVVVGDTFPGTSSSTHEGKTDVFHTCYKAIDKEEKDISCWAASYYYERAKAHLQCSPIGNWHVRPGYSDAPSCGNQCENIVEVPFRKCPKHAVC